jgi:signal transduction histidine kinase
MNDLTSYIFFFLIGTTVLNLIIAVVARNKTKYEEYNLLIFYWISLFITYFSAALLSQTKAQIAIAFFFQTPSVLIFARFLTQSRGLRPRYKTYLPILAVGMIVSACLIYADFGFTLSILPFTATLTLPFYEPIWNTLITERKESNWIEKLMAVVFITGIINCFNYAFFRLDPDSAWWGWSVSIAQYQCISILLPLLINHHRNLLEKMHVGQVMEKLAGPHENYDMEIDELYRNLEAMIIEKDQLNKQLSSMNLHLEEEREMNEILIKTISHDIANPLTVVKSYVEMIQSGRIPPEDVNLTLEKIKLNTVSALGMIKRIRNAILTRNQSSLTKIVEIPVIQTLKESLESFDSKLKEKELSVLIDNNLQSEYLVLADEKSLKEHVLANVISNAIKFSYRKSTVKIKATELENHVRLEIIDTGIGMAKDRLEKRTTQPYEGTEGEMGSGLGFVLMGYFLRKFGGRYQVLSEGLEKGTTVRLDLRKSSGSL